MLPNASREPWEITRNCDGLRGGRIVRKACGSEVQRAAPVPPKSPPAERRAPSGTFGGTSQLDAV